MRCGDAETLMFAQILAVTGMNVRMIPQRLGSSAVAICGIVGVVIVFVAVLSIAEGLRGLEAAGDPDIALVLRAGSDTEMTSGFYMEHVNAIADAPGVARDRGGRQEGAALVSPELLVIINVPLRRNGIEAQAPLRGVLPVAFDVHHRLSIVSGRRFTPGRNEVIVGRAAQRQYAGLDIGSTITSGQNAWRVVGIFADDESVAEGEIWCDARVAQPVYNRNNSYQSVSVRLASRDQFDTVKDALTTDPRLTVMVMRQSDYYAEQSRDLQHMVRGIGFVITGLMALGAIFAAVNTMYSAVAARTSEIATLRALGFDSMPVVVSVLVEAVLLGAAGAVIGGAIAWVALDGFQTSTLNFQMFSQVSFKFSVTPRLLGQALLAGVAMSLLGGALPALRAARLPVIDALREL
jgi:putative ABC transport system permease protein